MAPYALNTYQQQLRALFSPAQRRVFQRLHTPQKIQSFLDHFPANALKKGEHTMRAPAEVLKVKKAHCMEGALLAATALAYHGKQAWLLDLASQKDDFDHVVCLFKEHGRWGAVSKTNYPVLRWRDPVYASVRELAMSYFHEYFLDSGRKTLLSYSAPFDLTKFDPSWVLSTEDVDWLADKLTDSRHYRIAPQKNMKSLRKAAKIEIRAASLREWGADGTRL